MKEQRAIAPVEASQQAVEVAKHNIAILEEMARSVLEVAVDYGKVPGIPGQMLFDPGAAKIMAAFNCYPKHEVLKEKDDGETLSYILEAHLVSRYTGEIVGSGIGAASTMETKYKYRWVEKPEEWGFSGEAIKALRSRKVKRGNYEFIEYRIPNPERGELQNTLLKMAAKRAEVDAVMGLPGVGSALRKLFNGMERPRASAPPASTPPTAPEPSAPEKPETAEEWKVWSDFWGETKRLGLTSAEVHSKLGVASVKDWVATGKTLAEALQLLRGIKS